MRSTATRRLLPGMLGIGGASLLLAACGGGGGKAAGSSTTSTLPPLPPTVVAFVTLAGAGNNLGYGHLVSPVTVSSVGAGPAIGTKIPVGTYPDAIAVNPAGTWAYVASYTSNTVTPINLRTGTASKAIPVGIGPADIAIAPDGATAYVTDDGSASTLGDTVTPINLKTDKPEAPIKVGGGPQGIAVTPDGATAYVADAGAIVTGQSGGVGDTVTPIDLATRQAERPIKVGNGPTGVAISPDGSTVFVTNLDSGSVSPISSAANTAASPISVEGGPIAVTIAHNEAWVVDTPASGYTGSNLTPISLSTDRAGKPIPLPAGAQDIAVTPDSTTAWVTCLNAGVIVPIDLATHHAGRAVRVPGGPFAIAIASEPQGGPTSPAAGTPTTTKPKSKNTSSTS